MHNSERCASDELPTSMCCVMSPLPLRRGLFIACLGMVWIGYHREPARVQKLEINGKLQRSIYLSLIF